MSKIKKYFSTPKKAISATVCVGAALALIGGTTAYAARSIAVTGAIGSNNALNFAAADAGVDPAAVLLEGCEFGFEMGQFAYEVEFYADGTEYDYLIKSSDGTVLKKEAKISNDEEKMSKLDSIKPVAEKNEKQLSETPDNAISLEEAKKTALEDAGVAESAAKFTKQKAEYENGVRVYDIEFFADNIEYEYEINAATGAILDKSVEVADGHNNRPAATGKPVAVETTTKKAQPVKSTEKANSANAISLEEAKKTALEDAGVAESAAKFTKQKTEYENGVKVYDIEFFADGIEYEYEINATTGTILDKSADRLAPVTKSGSGAHIGIDRAKEIAAEKAGTSVNEVVFKKAKLERDDGISVYEIEFFKGSTEYEFTIHATTGEILESDIERA